MVYILKFKQLMQFIETQQQEFTAQFNEFFDDFLISQFQQSPLQTNSNNPLPQEFLFLINDPSYIIQQNGRIIENQKTSIFKRCIKRIEKKILRPIRKAWKQFSKRYLQKLTNPKHSIFQKIFHLRTKKLKSAQRKNFISVHDETEHHCIIIASSPSRLFWDIICMLLILYAMMMIPFRLSFEDESEKWKTFDLIDNVSDCLFLLDIILNFNTTIFQQGQQVYDRKKIALEYIKFWFWLDLASSFPFGLVLLMIEGNDNSYYETAQSVKQGAQIIKVFKIIKFLKVIKLLRIVKLKVMFERIMEYLELNFVAIYFAEFFKLCLIILFLAHVIACIWHGVSTLDSTNNWIIEQSLEDATWDSRYLTSMYWAITTMVAIGYGDIVPMNIDEKLVAIGAMLLACAIYGYIMETVMHLPLYLYLYLQLNRIVIQMENLTTNEKKELDMADKYMRQKNLTIDLQVRVHKYLEYVQENRRKNLAQEGNLISQLPNSLKRQLFIQINGKILSKSAIFIQNFSSNLLYQMALILKENLISPEESIFRVDDPTELQTMCIYFIKEGEVEIYFKKTTLAKLGKKQTFGEIGFFSNLRMANAKTSQFSDVFKLQRNEFLKLVRRYPKDQEIFCQIKDSILFYKNYDALSLKCYICREVGHIALECPVVMVASNRTKDIYELRQIEQNFKKGFLRKQRKSKHSLMTIKANEALYPKLLQTVLVELVSPEHLMDERITVPTYKYRTDLKVLDQKHQNDEIHLLQQKIESKKQIRTNQKHLSQINIAQSLIAKKVQFYLTMRLKHQSLIFDGFESVKSYKLYFPNNNINNILESTDEIYFKQKSSLKSKLSRVLTKKKMENKQKSVRIFDRDGNKIKIRRQNNIVFH